MSHYKIYDLNGNFLKEEEYNFNYNENCTHRKDFTGIIECSDKCRIYKLNGKIHRLDGPAYSTHDGYMSFYINDEKICNDIKQFNLYVDLMRLKGLL